MSNAAAAEREVLIRCVYRTGMQTVERTDDRYYVTIRNRSYESDVEVPITTARRFYAKMRRDLRVPFDRRGGDAL